jgi:hypothetical protein
MKKYEKLVRLSPKIFLVAAVLDFAKQLLWLLPFWLRYHNQVLTAADYGYSDGRYTVEFLDRVLSLFLYPLGWVASAIIVGLLLNVYDSRTGSLEVAK